MRSATLAALWRTAVTETAERTDADSREALERIGVRRLDREAGLVLLTAVLCLIFIHFFGRPGYLEDWRRVSGTLHLPGVAAWVQGYLFSPEAKFHARVFWAVTRAIGFLLMPGLVILLVLRRPLVDYGLRVRGILPHGWWYLAMLVLIAPAVVIASFTAQFQATYPFYRVDPGERLWPNFWIWELLYASQFVGIEFFFRGFLLHGLKRRMGFAAIWVSVVPYTMIHFEKPFAECLGAIVAGLVLGTLSLKTGSMWWGAAIHTAVAWGMDLLSLGHQGRL